MSAPNPVLDPWSLRAGVTRSGHDLKAMISDLTAHLCEERFGSHLAALVLTGSLARDEATFLRQPNGWTLAGDAEFLAVFGGAPLPRDTDLNDVARTVMSRLAACGTRCEITLAGVRPSFFRRLPPSIFAYELRECGQVISGNPSILSLIPSFSETDIPREDAWRMLANRLVEQLEVAGELADGTQALSAAAHYRTVKLYLDLVTSLTVFAGIYRPSYRARMGMLRSAAGRGSNPLSLFSLDDFLDQVDACTEWKLAALAPAASERGEFMRKAIGYARRLWRWELAQLTGLDETLPEQSLLENWMGRQPLTTRFRGWLLVLRDDAAPGNWKHWRRWAARLVGPSPRYRVYAAATTLLFSLADADGPAHPAWGRDWTAASHVLPVEGRGSCPAGAPAWRRLAGDVLWNYHHFLTGTRA